MKHPQLTGFTLTFIACFFWSGNFIFAKFSMAYYDPIFLNILRWIGTFLVLLPFAYKHIKSHFATIKSNALLLFLVAFFVSGFGTFSYLGLKYTLAINASVITATTPAFIPLIAFMLFREKITLQVFLGFCLALFGTVLLQSQGDLSILLNMQFNIGDLYLLIAAIFWAFYSILIPKIPSLPQSLLLVALSVFALPCILPFLLIFKDPEEPLFIVNTYSIATVAYVVIFASIVSLQAYSRAIEIIGTLKTGISLYLSPIISITMAVMILKEVVVWSQAFGLIFVFAGILLTFYPKGKIKNKKLKEFKNELQ